MLYIQIPSKVGWLNIIVYFEIRSLCYLHVYRSYPDEGEVLVDDRSG
jgi:hypothetical protein